jgi:hypothetical protein
MVNPIDWLARRKYVAKEKGEGIDLAIRTLNKFKGRKFVYEDGTYKYYNADTEDVLRFINNILPHYYIYTTKAKRYRDRIGTPQAKIMIIGKIGSLSQAGKFNPFDVKYRIRTK